MRRNSFFQVSYGLLLSLLFLVRCSDNVSLSDISSATTDEENINIVPSQTLTIKSNIRYGQAPDLNNVPQDLLLDLYFPPQFVATKKYPLVLMVHGGAYYMGDKADMKGDCIILADSGFVVASINYRMGWDHGVADCDGDMVSKNQAAYRALQDSNAALRYLTSKANKYGIDTTWIFVGGQSAGSSITLNTAYINNAIAQQAYPDSYALLGPVNTSGNPLTNVFKIKGVCNMWGALPDSTLITANSALPTIAFHGTADTVVPYNYGYSNSCSNYPVIFGSLCIHRQLLRYHAATITNLVIGGGHGPSAYHHDFLMSNTACFFKRIIKRIPIRNRVDTTLVSSCN